MKTEGTFHLFGNIATLTTTAAASVQLFMNPVQVLMISSCYVFNAITYNAKTHFNKQGEPTANSTENMLDNNFVRERSFSIGKHVQYIF